MKISFKIATTFALLSLLLLFSCKKGKSLSELRAEERAAIAKHITDNKLKITEADSIPDDAVFDETEYYHLPSGLYINIENKGTGEKPKKGDKVAFRYNTFDLSNNLLVPEMSSTEYYYRDAIEFKYGSGTCSFKNESEYSYNSTILNSNSLIISGIHEAIGYLRVGGAAYLIVPSSIGSADAQSDIQAYRYEIRHIKIID